MQKTVSILFMLVLIISPCSAQTMKGINISKEFDGISIIDISTVSGNCKILKHDEQAAKIFLTYNYKPIGSFEPIISKEENKLIIKEKMHSSNSGKSEWVLMVPKNIDINIKSASGNIKIERIAGQILVNTASGNIDASEITILGDSRFNSASGNVKIILNESPQFNLLVSSSSGNSTLDFNHHTISGHLEMKAREFKGTISSPLEFDNETEEVHNNQKYIVKTLTLEKISPTITIHTASGTAVLKK